jgi:hypothetical protein
VEVGGASDADQGFLEIIGQREAGSIAQRIGTRVFASGSTEPGMMVVLPSMGRQDDSIPRLDLRLSRFRRLLPVFPAN